MIPTTTRAASAVSLLVRDRWMRARDEPNTATIPITIAISVKSVEERVRKPPKRHRTRSASGLAVNRRARIIRVATRIAAAERNMLSVSGWNIAAVFDTTGKNAKKAMLAAHTPGRPGATSRASARRIRAVPNTSATLRIWAPRYDASGAER